MSILTLFRQYSGGAVIMSAPGACTSGGQCSCNTTKLAEYAKSHQFMNKQHYKHVEMAPSTRSTVRDTTPDRPIDLCERSTRKRIRFFEAYDSRSSHESMSSIAALKGINKSTASR
jgi:hypothetical protein